jgi:sterol desaturase/sphingolipid hydroxylase (fatty acid hydroxylase superfamily)
MPILTFYHSAADLIITNSIPQVITLLMFPYISLFQFNLIATYKSFIEISGHSSKKLYPSGSFSQCIWLPKILDISLYAEDHTLHHSHNNCNYSKRFSLWDKLFGTYKNKYKKIKT